MAKTFRELNCDVEFQRRLNVLNGLSGPGVRRLTTTPRTWRPFA